MTDIFEKYKDYIIFTSIKQEIPVTYFKHNKLYIGIHTNKTEYLRYVCDARFLYKNCPEDKIIGNIFCAHKHSAGCKNEFCLTFVYFIDNFF